METADLPEGFIRLPGHGETLIHRSAVIGLHYRAAQVHGIDVQTGQKTARPYTKTIITIQGGREYELDGRAYREIIEWLKT